MTKKEVNLKMNQISIRNIFIASVASFFMAIALLSFGNAVDYLSLLMFTLFYLGTGISMVSIAMERDYKVSIEDRILGLEAARIKESKNIYDSTPINSKILLFLIIAVLALNWIYICINGGPIWVIVNLIVAFVFVMVVGSILAISIKCLFIAEKINPSNAIYVIFVLLTSLGAGLFYAMLFTNDIKMVLQLLPMFAISAGIFTAIELVILSGLHRFSIWKNIGGCIPHLLLPAGIMFVLVLDYEFTNNLSSVSWKIWVENYMTTTKIYFNYMLPALFVGAFSSIAIKNIKRD